jgi:hypothetical protein
MVVLDQSMSQAQQPYFDALPKLARYFFSQRGVTDSENGTRVGPPAAVERGFR